MAASNTEPGYHRWVITLTFADPRTVLADALVVVLADRQGVTVPLGSVPEPVQTLVAEMSKPLGLSSALETVVRTAVNGLQAPVVVCAGAGSATSAEQIRRAVGAAIMSLSGTDSVAVVVPPQQVAATAEGAALAAYTFSRYQADAKKPVPNITLVLDAEPVASDQEAVTRAQILADAVHLTRDLINTPPNHLYPEVFAAQARDAAAALGVEVTVMDEHELAAGGYGGLVGVGQGSSRPARLVRLAYRPQADDAAAPQVALVGKGITFDTGGISIKAAGDMHEMTSDMSGAATVLGTILAAARLGLPVSVTGWLCLAENMPSSTAQRPGDVVTIRNGTTVEVLNTDAEGRMVLADGLSAAVEEKPDLVIDVATLTGAQMIAFGRRYAAVMGTESVRDAVVAAAGRSGELFWPMPLPEELDKGLKSKVADVANIGDRWGGMLSAGIFLQKFVADTPWAHLDVAGPAYNSGSAWGYTSSGGTGMGIRTLLELLSAQR